MDKKLSFDKVRIVYTARSETGEGTHLVAAARREGARGAVASEAPPTLSDAACAPTPTDTVAPRGALATRHIHVTHTSTRGD